MAYLDDEGVITMRVATQVVEHYRDVAKVLDLPHSRVRVLAPFVGGGFGGKEDMTHRALSRPRRLPHETTREDGLDPSGVVARPPEAAPDAHAIPYRRDSHG